MSWNDYNLSVGDGGGGDRFYLLRQDFDGTPGDGGYTMNGSCV
jgi:hypothetical protein